MNQPTFLLLDLENIQPEDLSALTGDSCQIKIFLGAHQTKVPVTLARSLQAFVACRTADQDTEQARREQYQIPEWEIPVVEVVCRDTPGNSPSFRV